MFVLRCFRNLAKELGYLRLANLALCNGQGKVEQSLFVSFKLNVVDCQKDDRDRGAGTLVAVHERMAWYYSARRFIARPNRL